MTRIIAGTARGRRLEVPAGLGTRPTADRAREGLFSSLLSLIDLDGAGVLDLYAGSGALGLEALSRGAATATMVEDDPAAVTAIRANIDTLRLPGAHVVPQKVETFLAKPPEPRYDLVLLDPPYELEVEPVLATLVPWLAPGAVVAVERRTRSGAPAWPEGLTEERSRRYGEATIWYALA
ncbi:MAG: 16S rRNA (guanine(966)-N(2))-methyltransferase RsmD [Actinobacteria bacterium]|nr:16S rRNA (guanine(966)-N(2))-methyltransferase RsmD [Actinomycetota bacterium]MCA1720379.1 16S rRNA (guanine(966)-N(2))-methyltransferase RsmD [Actinomycetota bacterium]